VPACHIGVGYCRKAARFTRERAAIVSGPTLPFVECDQIHAGLAVSDIVTALEYYTTKNQ
jgi:hypothetical protein